MTSLIGLPFIMMFLYGIIPLAPAVYLFLKWRSYRDEEPGDPSLGMKVILSYFRLIALHVLLLGLVLTIYGALQGRYGNEMRSGLGLILGGGVLYVLQLLVRTRTSLTGVSQVERLFRAVNLLIAGLVANAAVIAFFIGVLAGEWSQMRLPLAALVVYGPICVLMASAYWGFSLFKK